MLAPVANVIRFYEALPVVSWDTASAESLAALVELGCDCAWSPLLTSAMLACGSAPQLIQSWIAASLTLGAFTGDLESLRMLPGGFPNIALLTSVEDLPPTTDIKHLAQGLDAVRGRLAFSALSTKHLPIPVSFG